MHAIDKLNNIPTLNNYAKILPVTQSSGTGKSKIVDEVAKQRILFPLCLREDVGQEYFGERISDSCIQITQIWHPAYPPADTAVRDYLQSAPSVDEEIACNEYLRTFFHSLFVQALDQATRFFLASEPKVPYATMARKFYDFFETNRKPFHSAVLARRAAVSDSLLNESLKGLVDYLQSCCSDWPVPAASTSADFPPPICPLLLSIDEVHTLYNPRPQDSDSFYSLYSRAKHVISQMVSHSFCVIILSTATNISKLPPSRHVAPSIRERAENRRLPNPFLELPFDAHICADPLVSGRDVLASVGSLGFVAKFGRPM
jgi:hypothetical protein